MTLVVNTAPDLSICDREPITRLDRIQNFGFLIAMYNDWTVFRASANLHEHLQVTAEAALGQALDDLVDNVALHDVRNRVTLLYITGSARLYSVVLVAGAPAFDLHLYISGDLLILEGEPSSNKDQLEAASLVRSMMERLERADSIGELHRQAARQIRVLSGFDRVMIYRFDHEGVGEVIAEEFNGVGESWLGLHFPASDIPEQARALYLQNPLRIIADVHSETVLLIPGHPAVAAPIDLSLAVTRAVSPVHIEYLRNMGVAASLSISIIVDGRLWGLIACHHGQPRLPSFPLRTVSELFGRMYSLTLESRIRKDGASDEAHAARLAEQLIAGIIGNGNLLENAHWLLEMVHNSIECDGLAICRGGGIYRSGSTPDSADIALIYRYLELRSPTRIFEVDKLSSILPEAMAYTDRAAGMIAIPISRTPRDYILLFRRERPHALRWGGNPAKPATASADGLRISPRKSFEAFEQQIQGRSNPITERERRMAESVRRALIEVILRYSENADDERRHAAERQELLIAELNHRIRNILALIRGLITATGEEAWDLVSYVRALGGRVQALARAHEQVTQQNWGPVAIAKLIENECSAYLEGGDRQLIVEGPAVFLEPGAVSTMALVVHELVTNSAKYGALSASGTVIVRVEHKAGIGVELAWQECNGPTVQMPTRRGFGSVIIERTIPFDFQGRAEVRYPATGLEAKFFIPEIQISKALPMRVRETLTLSPRTAQAETPAGKLLEGLLVLLLEDNLIIALEAEDALRGLGALNVITVSTVGAAESAIDEHLFGFAMLDVQIGSETSLNFSSRLRQLGVPHILASGYGAKDIDKHLPHAVVIQKPYQLDHLSKAIGAVLTFADRSPHALPTVMKSSIGARAGIE